LPAESTISRRLSEFLGVALFALALIWLIALVTYDPTDPVWFFTTDATHAPANFVGRVGAFLAELSFQLFGYGAYLIPAAVSIVGWHYFWCQKPDAVYTKAFGVVMLFSCASARTAETTSTPTTTNNASTTDLGVTLAKWGVPEGPYLVLPLFGSTTVREAFAFPVDRYLFDPLSWYSAGHSFQLDVHFAPTFVYLVTLRSSAIDAEGLLEGGCDCFVLETFQDLNEALNGGRKVRFVPVYHADRALPGQFPDRERFHA